MTMRVGILAGGWNSEREVSISSSKMVEKALKKKRYHTIFIDVTQDLSDLIKIIASEKIDIIFNGLHGTMGEDGTIQGVLDYLNIPYTHSGLTASAIAMDKYVTKNILKNHALSLPKHDYVQTTQFKSYTPTFEGPYVLKPNSSGSACGVHIEKSNALSSNQISEYANIFSTHPEIYGSDILVEEYIPGLELTVGILDNKPLTVTNIIAHREFYNYEAKYAAGGSSHEIPANIPQSIFDQAMKDALTAHQAINIHYLSRVDFRYNPLNEQLYFLEINTQPGLTQTSLFPEQAEYCGISFETLIDLITKNTKHGVRSNV